MKIVLDCGAALSLAFLLALEPALAQFPPPPSASAPPEDLRRLSANLRKRPHHLNSTSPEPGLDSSPKSEVTRHTSLSSPSAASGAETRYPDLDCVGKLTRIGSSKSYVFFVETITKGQADKGGRCPDGTVTVARQGDKLALRWFGSIQDDVVVAYGTLSRK